MDSNTVISILAGTGLLSLMGKLIYDGIKAKPKQDIDLCPIRMSGTIAVILKTGDQVEKNEDMLKEIRTNLHRGIAVAERNTQHYEDFVKTLASLTSASTVQTQALRELIQESRKHTETLIKLSRNGGQ